MKVRFFCALIALVLLVAVPAKADARQHFARQALVRLQVIGASNSEVDQATKLRVRDAVRAVAVPLAAEADSPEQAFEILARHTAELTRAARTVDETAAAEVVIARFPMRAYGAAMVPPGEYRALRVTLGAGAGRNWWCVIYPDLCAINDAQASALRSGDQIRFYSSILRWLFGGDDE